METTLTESIMLNTLHKGVIPLGRKPTVPTLCLSDLQGEMERALVGFATTEVQYFVLLDQTTREMKRTAILYRIQKRAVMRVNWLTVRFEDIDL
jgi:hypothetical protein